MEARLVWCALLNWGQHHKSSDELVTMAKNRALTIALLVHGCAAWSLQPLVLRGSRPRCRSARPPLDLVRLLFRLLTLPLPPVPLLLPLPLPLPLPLLLLVVLSS